MGASKRKEKILRDQGVLNPDPERVVDSAFQKGDFFDARDMVQVKYEMIRKTEKEGYTVTEASDVYGLSRQAFYKAKAALEEEGLAGLIPKKRGPRGPHKLTKEVMGAIEEWIEEEPAVGGEELAGMIAERFSINVHPQTVQRAVASRKKKRK